MTLKPGTSFKKNDLLYKVSSEEMFYSLNARKAQLTNLVIAILPDISIDFPSEYEKWNLFLEGIKPSEFLPSLPSFSNKKESLFINSKGIYGEYWSIKGLEEKISKYIYLAPFTGVVSEVYIEPGSIINPGSRIARIFNRENMEVKLPIPIDVFEKFKNLERCCLKMQKEKLLRKVNFYDRKEKLIPIRSQLMLIILLLPTQIEHCFQDNMLLQRLTI